MRILFIALSFLALCAPAFASTNGHEPIGPKRTAPVPLWCCRAVPHPIVQFPGRF